MPGLKNAATIFNEGTMPDRKLFTEAANRVLNLITETRVGRAYQTTAGFLNISRAYTCVAPGYKLSLLCGARQVRQEVRTHYVLRHEIKN